jgi:hypothetical protein
MILAIFDRETAEQQPEGKVDAWRVLSGPAHRPMT